MIILNIKMQTFYSMILSTVQVNFQFGHIKFIHLISQTPLLILLIKLKKTELINVYKSQAKIRD